MFCPNFKCFSYCFFVLIQILWQHSVLCKAMEGTIMQSNSETLRVARQPILDVLREESLPSRKRPSTFGLSTRREEMIEKESVDTDIEHSKQTNTVPQEFALKKDSLLRIRILSGADGDLSDEDLKNIENSYPPLEEKSNPDIIPTNHMSIINFLNRFKSELANRNLYTNMRPSIVHHIESLKPRTTDFLEKNNNWDLIKVKKVPQIPENHKNEKNKIIFKSENESKTQGSSPDFQRKEFQKKNYNTKVLTPHLTDKKIDNKEEEETVEGNEINKLDNENNNTHSTEFKEVEINNSTDLNSKEDEPHFIVTETNVLQTNNSNSSDSDKKMENEFFTTTISNELIVDDIENEEKEKKANINTNINNTNQEKGTFLEVTKFFLSQHNQPLEVESTSIYEKDISNIAENLKTEAYEVNKNTEDGATLKKKNQIKAEKNKFLGIISGLVESLRYSGQENNNKQETDQEHFSGISPNKYRNNVPANNQRENIDDDVLHSKNSKNSLNVYERIVEGLTNILEKRKDHSKIKNNISSMNRQANVYTKINRSKMEDVIDRLIDRLNTERLTGRNSFFVLANNLIMVKNELEKNPEKNIFAEDVSPVEINDRKNDDDDSDSSNKNTGNYKKEEPNNDTNEDKLKNMLVLKIIKTITGLINSYSKDAIPENIKTNDKDERESELIQNILQNLKKMYPDGITSSETKIFLDHFPSKSSSESKNNDSAVLNEKHSSTKLIERIKNYFLEKAQFSARHSEQSVMKYETLKPIYTFVPESPTLERNDFPQNFDHQLRILESSDKTVFMYHVNPKTKSNDKILTHNIEEVQNKDSKYNFLENIQSYFDSREIVDSEIKTENGSDKSDVIIKPNDEDQNTPTKSTKDITKHKTKDEKLPDTAEAGITKTNTEKKETPAKTTKDVPKPQKDNNVPGILENNTNEENIPNEKDEKASKETEDDVDSLNKEDEKAPEGTEDDVDSLNKENENVPEKTEDDVDGMNEENENMEEETKDDATDLNKKEGIIFVNTTNQEQTFQNKTTNEDLTIDENEQNINDVPTDAPGEEQVTEADVADAPGEEQVTEADVTDAPGEEQVTEANVADAPGEEQVTEADVAGLTEPTTQQPAVEFDCNYCGLSQANRIIGGEETQIDVYPWMVQLIYSQSATLFCGGTVLTEMHVLTAAHCVIGMLPDEIIIRAGHTSPNEEGRNYTVESFVTHENYSYYDITKYDIALIKLQEPLEFGRKVWPICLPTREVELEGQKGVVAGWGSVVEGGSTSEVLNAAGVNIVEGKTCHKETEYTKDDMNELVVCAAAKDKDSCQGDSGGPLMVLDEAYTQVGITSWGVGCALKQYPGVYTKVSRYYKWINDNIAEDSKVCPTPNKPSISSGTAVQNSTNIQTEPRSEAVANTNTIYYYLFK